MKTKLYSTKRLNKDNIVLYAPAIFCILATIIVPLLYSFGISFTDLNLKVQSSGNYVGLKNYITAFKDEYFRQAIWTTLKFTIVSVFFELILGFFVALLLNSIRKGREIYFSIIIVPMMISAVAVGLIWRLLLHPDLGIVNYMLSRIGIAGRAWTGDAKYALGTLIFVDVWQEMPYIVLLNLAGLVSLPREPYEAISIDGASRFQQLVHLTIPMMKPTILVATLLRFISALKAYDLVYVMTKGGPGTSTEVMGYNIYKQAYSYMNTGRASAMAYILLFMILIISIFFVRVNRTDN